MPSAPNLIAVPCSDAPTPAERRGLNDILASDPFGLALKRLRRRRGLTLAHVADVLGVSKPSVWAWENGKCRPRPERIAKIAALLGVLPEDLSDASLPSHDAMLSSHDAAQVIEDCRQRIAMACGTESRSVRIMGEF